jgi:hypothetical protein
MIIWPGRISLHTGEPLGSFAEARLIEVQQDREILQQIVDRVGQGSIDLKEAAAWVRS